MTAPVEAPEYKYIGSGDKPFREKGDSYHTYTKKKTVTLRDVVTVLRRTSIQQYFGTLIKSGSDYIEPKGNLFDEWIDYVQAACAMGAAGVELGVDPSVLQEQLAGIPCDLGLPKYTGIRNVNEGIVRRNDTMKQSFKEIADAIETHCGPFLDQKMSVNEARYRIKVASEASRA